MPPVGKSSRCCDPAEFSGTFWNISLVYKFCNSLYILIGLQQNMLYSKSNQRTTPFSTPPSIFAMTISAGASGENVTASKSCCNSSIQVYGDAGSKYAFSYAFLTQAGVFFGSILCVGPFVGLHSAKSQITSLAAGIPRQPHVRREWCFENHFSRLLETRDCQISYNDI